MTTFEEVEAAARRFMVIGVVLIGLGIAILTAVVMSRGASAASPPLYPGLCDEVSHAVRE